MYKIKKLPSGSYNIRKYSHTDENRKKHYKSFTAPTKAEVRRLVAEWTVNRSEYQLPSVTVLKALNDYVDLKRDVLSPSTIRAYDSYIRNYIEKDQIKNISIGDLTTIDVQRWVSMLRTRKLSAKTINNAYGLLLSAVTMYDPDIRLKATLPQKTMPSLHCPDKTEVNTLLETVREKGDHIMEFAILCAAFIPARRGEICALTYDDIDGNFITISKSIVQNTQNGWEQKPPKTFSSYRTVEVPDAVIKALPPGTGRIVPWTPDCLTDRFKRYVKNSGVTPFRFHDLRHFGASMLLTVMSPRYVMDRGGWASSHTMNRVYNNVIDLDKQRQTKKALKLFSDANMKRG